MSYIDVDSKRRNITIENLNEKYAFLIQNFNVKEAYSKIVTWKPYKVLSCFVYDWSYIPLKRGKLDEPLTPTRKLIKNKTATNITPEDDKEFLYKSHKFFVTNLRIAEKTANEKKRNVDLLWRGYKLVVEPGQERTLHDIRGELLHALREIMKTKKIPNGEQKVRITCIIIY